jgi:hypothetical protein
MRLGRGLSGAPFAAASTRVRMLRPVGRPSPLECRDVRCFRRERRRSDGLKHAKKPPRAMVWAHWGSLATHSGSCHRYFVGESLSVIAQVIRERVDQN